MPSEESTLIPPKYCKYASGPCDQSFDGLDKTDAFFIYPSQPVLLANTIKDCVTLQRKSGTGENWITWEDLEVGGRLIFCEICKIMRGTKTVIANITNLNFNVLFEIGYAFGLRKPVLPIRDSTYEAHKRQFDEIGIFDTMGYEHFTNSYGIIKILENYRPTVSPVTSEPELNRMQPIFYIRSPIDIDGSVKLFSCLKKSMFRFRTFDSRETSRLSLHDAYKRVHSSVSVVAHLINQERTGATVHNARAAFVCGMALAAGKHVLMFQEGDLPQPIDYRDIIIPYTDTEAIPYYVENLLRETADTLQMIDETHVPLPTGLLERIDLGDVAAENEIRPLNQYFVKTPQYQQVRQGHARIVIGRKGSGKTALFYGIRSQFSPTRDELVLDLKPEGHQFTRLRELVLEKVTEGLQLHTLTAFWHYLLLLEVTKKLIYREQQTAYQNRELLEKLNELEDLYAKQLNAKGDFSERLMALVDRVIENFPKSHSDQIQVEDITRAVYKSDIKELNKVLYERLQKYGGVWILFDNIDKGFPAHGLQKEDILIIRCLLEATRKLQRSMESKRIECITTIFIRKDVFDHLVDLTPDRGKEGYVNLDWSDTELIKELLVKRIRFQVPELPQSFDEAWRRVFDPHVRGESSFQYILSRTFLRPRDILNFVRKCMQVAVSRDHKKVQQEDILTAEQQFSNDMLDELRYEIRDIFPELPDFVLSFIDVNHPISEEDVYNRLKEVGVPEDQLVDAKDILLWFSFLGFHNGESDSFAHEVSYNLSKLKAKHRGKNSLQTFYVIHPAFIRALC